jgi:peptidyl-prolyl cis-trans isomerase C
MLMHQTRTRGLAAAASLLALALAATLPAAAQTAAPAPAAGAQSAVADKVVARVDGVAITDSDVKVAMEELASSLQQMPEAQRRAYAIDYLIDLKLVARAGEKAKLAEGAEFEKRLSQARDRLVMERMLGKEGETATSEAAMRKFYDETVKTLKPDEEVRARHILVEKEEDAKAALERLKKGEDFAKLAGELSKDPGSGKEGGDLGYFTKERMVPEFAEAAFKLEKGGVSDVVKSQFGFHIIKVEDKRLRQPPPFEQVKEQLQRYLAQKAQQDLVLKLRADAKVERLEQPAAQ